MTPAQELAALKELGRRMRTAQIDYFKSRAQLALEESKRLEKQFDEAVGLRPKPLLNVKEEPR